MSIDVIKPTTTSTDYANSNVIPSTKIDTKAREDASIVQEPNRQTVAFPNDITAKEADKEENGNLQGGTSTSEAVKKAINEINKSNPNSIVQFGVHEATNRMTIKILDKESRKVIKEFPAEKTLDLIAKAWELAGIMVDEKR